MVTLRPVLTMVSSGASVISDMLSSSKVRGSSQTSLAEPMDCTSAAVPAQPVPTLKVIKITSLASRSARTSYCGVPLSKLSTVQLMVSVLTPGVTVGVNGMF